MLPINQLVSELQEGDIVEFITRDDERILGFYEGETEIHHYEPFEQLRIGAEPGKLQRVFSMASTLGIDPEGEDYDLEILLPEFSLTLKNGVYRVGENHDIKEGRILEPSKFKRIPEEPVDRIQTIDDSLRRLFSHTYRLTLPGEDNYVVANVVGAGESYAHLLLSPVTGWTEFPFYAEISEDSLHEGTLYVPERTTFLTSSNQEEGEPKVTSFRKVPFVTLELYVE